MDLTVERQQQMIAHLTAWIRERELESLAVLFLQANKPLALLGSQALLFFQPVLGQVGLMLGWRREAGVWAEYAALLENPDSIDHILSSLEC